MKETSSTRRRILRLCETPQRPAAIMQAVQCSRESIKALVSDGLLRNVGEHNTPMYCVTPLVYAEPPKRFETPAQIVQASSVWHYARRMASQSAAA